MDDDSLSRRAADFTAEWTQATLERRHREALNGTGGPSWGPSGAGGGISNAGVLAMAAAFGGVAGSLGGGSNWMGSAAMGAGLFVGLILAAKIVFGLLGWTWRLGARGTEMAGDVVGRAAHAAGGMAPSRPLSGGVGAVLGGAGLGAVVGVALASLAGGDVPVMEGVLKFAPLGAVLGLVTHLFRRARRH